MKQPLDFKQTIRMMRISFITTVIAISAILVLNNCNGYKGIPPTNYNDRAAMLLKHQISLDDHYIIIGDTIYVLKDGYYEIKSEFQFDTTKN